MMLSSIHPSRHVLALSLLLVLGACTSLRQAPVTPPASTVQTPISQPTTAPPLTAQSSTSTTHTVQQGETIYSIAARYKVSYLDVALWNNILDFTKLQPGQSLLIYGQQKSGLKGTPVIMTKGVTLPGQVQQIVVTPLGAPPGVMDQPQGGKVPYSPAALAAAKAAAVPRPATPAVTSVDTPALPTAWIWPVNGPVLAGFTSVQSTGTKGIDIGGVAGTQVKASADGKVFYAGSSLAGYGNMVIVRHADDFITVYAHNRKLLVKENQAVRQGQVIAELGEDGAATPVLHFEIRKRGITEDPLKYLPTR